MITINNNSQRTAQQMLSFLALTYGIEFFFRIIRLSLEFSYFLWVNISVDWFWCNFTSDRSVFNCLSFRRSSDVAILRKFIICLSFYSAQNCLIAYFFNYAIGYMWWLFSLDFIFDNWSGTMNVGVAHSDPNPNSTYFSSKGMWVTYAILVAFLHYVILSLPFLSVAMAWTLTNVIHNAVSLLLSI